MKTSNAKRLLLLFVAILLVVFTVACDKSTPEAQDTATMAPEVQDTTENEQAEITAEPTKAVDPLAALDYWKVDPDKRIYNILLLGMGQEYDGQVWAHNDTTMILQINLDTNEMKLVSFMRDMLVDIPKYGEDRLNNAHLVGGPSRAISTVENVFDVEIDNYASVNFVTFEQIMRIVGSIIIDVQSYEIEHLQRAESAVSIEGEMILGQGAINEPGENEFNEYLALSYARDRHSQRTLSDGTIVSSDRGRNERQREIIMAAWVKVKTKPLALIPASVFLAMPYVETDMSEGMIITLIKAMMENGAEIKDMSVPESNWAEWKAEDGTRYTQDELTAIYTQKKDAYDLSNQPTATDSGGTATPEPTEEPEAFPSFDRWRQSKNYASVIAWPHNSTIRDLHEFLGID